MIDQEYKAWCAFQLHVLGLAVLPMHFPVGGHCSCRGAWTCGCPAKQDGSDRFGSVAEPAGSWTPSPTTFQLPRTRERSRGG